MTMLSPGAAGLSPAAASASGEDEKKDPADTDAGNGGSENDKQDSDGVSGEEEKKPEAEKEPAESEKQNDAPKPAEASDDKDAKGEDDRTMEIGYIVKKNFMLSTICRLYISEMEEYLKNYTASHAAK